MQNGVLLMGGASLVALLYTRGDITTLVTLYAINVFVTFSLSQLAMCRFWFRDRQKRPDWVRQITIHVVGFILCFGILAVNLYEKFEEGAWVTVLVTGSVVGVFTLIRRHYRGVQQNLRRLDDILGSMPSGVGATTKPIQRNKPTAVLLVGGYAGLGVHSLLHHPAPLPRLLPELRLPLRGGHRLGDLQGHRRGGGAEGADPGVAGQVRRAGQRAGAGGDRADGDGNRGGGDRDRALPRGGARSSPGDCSSPGSSSSSRSTGTSGSSTTRRRTSCSGGCSSRG